MSSAAVILVCHAEAVTSSRGALMSWAQRTIWMALAMRTAASQRRRSRGGAQNIAPIATTTASSDAVTAADNSFLANINKSSYWSSCWVQGLLGELPCVSGALGAGPRLKSIAAEADFPASVDAPTDLLIEPATTRLTKRRNWPET